MSVSLELVMPWTLVVKKDDKISAVTEILSFDSQSAWVEAVEKHPGLIGMFKGDHQNKWISYE